MSITDELIEFIETHLYLGATALGGWKEAAFAIADRIDAEYQKAIRELNNLADSSVPLPVDADGVPWHIGDRTESGQTIQAMGLNSHGWHFVGTVNEIDPSIHHHYHAPTVEDVLREFAEKIIDSQIPTVHPTYEEAIAGYAAKLRLADDGEE